MTTPSIPKRYEVRSLLGEGGSGRVFRVQDSIRDRELALKLVTAAESAFLRREFDTLRQIRHENLIQVFDWGALPSGEAYYTMELIEGGDWSRRMGKPQPADDVRHILTGLLRGLAHLHCHGEIHGDLKPGNILLGAGGVVKITDAGMGGSGGRAEGMSGTPGYAAPEVWEGSPADIRSDLYSVGVMAYEALTGKHPFAGRTVRDVVSGQLEGWVSSPGVHGVRVPVDLERVMMRALERKPGLRQGSADEFMEGMGVEDRIGEILGGKLVGREKEMAEINRLLSSEEPGMPTLLYLTGEPSVGKTALLEEVGARLLGLGGWALEIDLSRGKSLEAQVAEHLAPAGAEMWQADDGSKDLHALLIDCGRRSPVLLYTAACDETAARNTLKALARYIWALSVESGQASRVVIALQSSDIPDGAEPFAQGLHVPPLSAVDCGALMGQMLGAANVQFELIAKLHALSGGNAGVLRSALASLIEQELLQRRDGTWAFREATLIHSMRLESGVNPWVIAWRHLSPTEQRAMLTLSLFRQPLESAKLRKLSMDRGIEDSLSTLQAKGFVRRSREGWIPASDGVRQTVQELASKESQAEIAATLLATIPDSGDGEERIDLELRYRPSMDRLERGLEAAERAVRRGDQYLGMKRLQACLEIAERAEARDRSRQICLRIAALLRQLGDDEGAASYLRRQESWGGGSPGPPEEARRSHVLGLIAMSKGDLDGARRHLAISIEMATAAGDRSLLLWCHADLAEIDWRHGDEVARRGVIERLKSVLSSQGVDTSLRNERAALMYELGAALIVSGASSDSTTILSTGLKTTDSDYWRMRISNAMASAHHYLGDIDGELKWLDEAWAHAERSRSDFFKARILSNRGGMLYYLGRFAEAADQNRLSAAWARRVGNAFEFIAGCVGVGICSIHLAHYEDACSAASEIASSALVLKDPHYTAKALEIEGLAYYFLGLHDAAQRCVREALASLRNRGHIEVRPRLDWLMARILRSRGEVDESRRLLLEAERRLLETRDMEDLWGVQIELNLIEAGLGKPEAAIDGIKDILRQSEQKRFLVVAVPAALAIAEILDDHGIDHGELASIIAIGLERAERSGMRELAWRLSYRMGSLACRAGQQREGQARCTHAIRILREIATTLTEDHRKAYLAAVHVASALQQMGAP